MSERAYAVSRLWAVFRDFSFGFCWVKRAGSSLSFISFFCSDSTVQLNQKKPKKTITL